MDNSIIAEKSVCFTGYRSTKFPFPFKASDKSYIEVEKKLAYNIEECIKSGHTTFLNGACEGYDILAAEIVLMFKKVYKEPSIRLICTVPFSGQEKNWSEDWQSRYNSILERADEVITLHQEYQSGAYYERNRYIVDNSNVIICYYDGQSGGTKYTLDYNSKTKQIRVINLAENHGGI